MALAESLDDFKERIGRIVVANNMNSEPVTVDDLCMTNAICILMKDAMKPTLMQTVEGTPIFVHAGPFANIGNIFTVLKTKLVLN